MREQGNNGFANMPTSFRGCSLRKALFHKCSPMKIFDTIGACRGMGKWEWLRGFASL